jgi:hypothetical protein
LQQASQRVDLMIKEAETWPGFKENEADILKTLQADSSISLERAYQKVVYPKLQTDRNKLREEVLKEINAQPRSTSAPATNTRSSTAKGEQSTIDHARVAYQKLGGS